MIGMFDNDDNDDDYDDDGGDDDDYDDDGDDDDGCDDDDYDEMKDYDKELYYVSIKTQNTKASVPEYLGFSAELRN